MSEAYTEGSEAPETPEPDDVESEEGRAEDSELPDEEGGGEDDIEGRPPRKTDWEKQAHDKAGLAAKERSRRRAVERQNAELAARVEALEARGQTDTDDLSELVASLRDDDDEPITDINQIKKVLKTFMARQAADRQAEGQRSQIVQTIQNISRQMDAYEKDFAEDHPDYLQAATYYRNARVSELEDLGYSGDVLLQKVASEFYSLASDVMKSGRDPAEVVYGLAKKRGFAAGKDAATKKLQKLQQAGASAGGPRAQGQNNGLTWDRVAKAKGSEKDKLFAALRKQELGKT